MPGQPLLIVDGANVVGSVPDGWWRDRLGAAARLRDALVEVATRGVAGVGPAPEVVLVVEGAARSLPATPGVRVVPAPNSGDDTIVELVRSAGDGRDIAVVTSDRALRERVRALGARVLGARTVRPDAPGPRG
ncbi:MAG: NYN domain-containing protein [Micromonosporaceae bacterium]